MKLLILDPRGGEHKADLFILEKGVAELKKMQLDYVPELHYDRANHQIIVVETELRQINTGQTRYWLKNYSADKLELLSQQETPVRPMYSGYPGRSTHVKSSLSGRFLYFLESTIHPQTIELYRLKVHRYDREKDEIQIGQIKIDSCLIDFDQYGEDEDQLCFHLSCEFPSVVAFGNFHSEELDFIDLENLPSRTRGPKETCGSWFSKNENALYCITGEGAIHQVSLQQKKSELLARLPLNKESFIPLQQICEAGGHLLTGVSVDIQERALSLASQIWRISTENGEISDQIDLPFPIMNFIITPDNQLIVGVSPYQKAVAIIDIKSGQTFGIIDGIGFTPAEVLAIP